LVNIVASIVSHPKPSLLMQPSDGALDHVPHFAEPAAMFGAALCQDRFDAQRVGYASA